MLVVVKNAQHSQFYSCMRYALIINLLHCIFQNDNVVAITTYYFKFMGYVDAELTHMDDLLRPAKPPWSSHLYYL